MEETQQLQQLDGYIENKLEYAKFLVNPKIESLFPEITKDLALSNLDYFGLQEIKLKLEVANLLLLYPDTFLTSVQNVLRDIFSILQVYRSRGGFESRLQRSSIQESDHKITEMDNKKKALFGFNRGQQQYGR